MDCDQYFVSNMAKFPAIDAKVAKKKEEGNYGSPQPGTSRFTLEASLASRKPFVDSKTWAKLSSRGSGPTAHR
jgi:hypothetical protein